MSETRHRIRAKHANTPFVPPALKEIRAVAQRAPEHDRRFAVIDRERRSPTPPTAAFQLAQASTARELRAWRMRRRGLRHSAGPLFLAQAWAQRLRRLLQSPPLSPGVAAGRSITTSAAALVLAQTLEARVARDAVVGPAGERDFADEFGLQPMEPCGRNPFGQRDRRRLRAQPFELRVDRACRARSLHPVPTLPV